MNAGFQWLVNLRLSFFSIESFTPGLTLFFCQPISLKVCEEMFKRMLWYIRFSKFKNSNDQNSIITSFNIIIVSYLWRKKLKYLKFEEIKYNQEVLFVYSFKNR